MRVKLDRTLPDATRLEIEKYVGQIERMLPQWIKECVMMYEDNGLTNAVCSCRTDYDYRILTVIIRPSFLENGQTLENLVHEIIHAYLSPLHDYARMVIRQLTEDVGREIILTQLDHFGEQVVEDLGTLIYGLIKETANEPRSCIRQG